MNPVDPKWLEILKASGWQTFAIATAMALLLYGSHVHYLPELPDSVLLLVAAVFLICAMLTFTSLISWALKIFNIRLRFVRLSNQRVERRELTNYIPHMTQIERAIIGHLLARGQKTFTTNQDGGNAMTLISRRIIIHALQPGQVFTASKCPFVVPDHLWEVLEKHKANFPTEIDPSNPNSPPPWHINWMNR